MIPTIDYVPSFLKTPLTTANTIHITSSYESSTVSTSCKNDITPDIINISKILSDQPVYIFFGIC